jgi:hypothetical protein
VYGRAEHPSQGVNQFCNARLHANGHEWTLWIWCLPSKALHILEKCIYERRYHAALREYYQYAHNQQRYYDWKKPPALAAENEAQHLAEKAPVVGHILEWFGLFISFGCMVCWNIF